MSFTPQGLLFVLGQCEPEVSTQDFNEWYDGEHAPARLKVPGITTAVRYQATDNEKPEWLAIYDLASPDTLKTEEYKNLRLTASENEKQLIPRVPVLQRRIYSLVAEKTKAGLPADDLPGKYLLVVLWSIPEEGEAEFNRWYDEEHTDMIADVPGWLRGRRYKMKESAELGRNQGPPLEGWNYMVVHEWEKDGCTQEPKFATAITTPWSNKMLAKPNSFAIRQFVLYKNFKKP